MRESDFAHEIERKEQRRLKAQHCRRSVLHGFGWFGLIGWSVALPALLGAALGLWIDREYPSGRSWTLMLMMLGLLLGCAAAWHFVASERREIEREQRNHHHEPRG